MVFAHDVEVALQAAAFLVNSAEEPETLDSVAQLDAFMAAYAYTGRHDRTQAELLAVQTVRPRLRSLLLAERDDAVELVNEVLAEHRAVPRLVRHDDWDWHLHAVQEDWPLADRILVETAMAVVDVVRQDESSRFGVCQDDTCEGVVVDLSRNRSRRYCSTACGNRNAVAAYRARQS
ncbi:RNA-binding protein [Aeromicrobium sp. Root495]|uniref:CGNR zinc finger domain-containing protein n=1 Tax=Aeromicrobium sp. Root495 TaxID=1736550 RepID=UPI0006F3630C|nr:CGNR zinc finger domain-containing protein [Aeromicrobium sp. Root495]KQY58122.1 RNA-binding protein [Aeromicrobium sp. Root495]RYJ07625.1 MAG: CGNR zinc finger domain-containing protein [Actinomycetales bacterium]